MTAEVLGRGIIEIVADATKLQAGISDAKSSLNTLRDAAKSAGETLNAQGIKYIRTLEKQDARLKTQAATFGQGKSEIAAYGAAQLGVAQTADSLVKSIAASEAAIKSKAKADRDAAAAAQQLVVQQQAQQQAQQGFLRDLQSKVDVGAGKLPSELLAIKAAQLGVTAQSGPLIAALVAQEKGLGNLATNARLARFQSQQLGFQLHDFFIQLQAGQNPLTAFLQQGSQLSGTFGGAGPAFKAVLGLITPLRVALAGAAGAVAGLGVAMYQGAQQSKAYADALVLSGNFAGQTAATVNTAVKSISASGEISRGAAREAVAAITATGEIGPKAFDASAEAAARFAQATGKSVKEVAADFATLGRDVTVGATKLNQSLNFLSAAQLQQIRNLQESGQQTEAYSLVIDALNTRLRSLEPNLGSLDKALRLTTNTWSKFWDAAFDVGRPDTIDDKIAKARGALERAQSPPIGARIDSALDIFNVNKRNPAAKEDAQENLRLLNRSKPASEAAAIFGAEQLALSKSTAEIRARRDAQLDATKTDEARTKALRKLTDEFAELEKTGQGYTPKQKQILIDLEKSKFEPPKGSRPRVDNSAAREAEQVRRAELDNDLKFLRDKFGEERDTIAFHQRELQAIYAAGNISLAAFYDDRERTIAEGVQRELNLLTDEQARLEVELETPAVKANQSERVKLEGDLAESIARTAKVEREAGRAATLAGHERAAAYKQLDNAVNDYHANLLQLQGDEAGAARLRAKQAIDQARDLAKQSGGRITQKNVDDEERALEQTIQSNKVKTTTSQINQRLSIEEERIALQQRTGSIGEIEALRKIGDARTQIFAQAEKQVVELERLAKERPLDLQLTIDASQARLELEKFSAELDPLRDKFNDLFRDSAGDAINDFISGTKSAKDALKGFGKSILAEINSIASKQIAGDLFGQKGLLSGAGSLFADFFGGKKADAGRSTGAGESGGSPLDVIGDIFGIKRAESSRKAPQLDTSAVSTSLSNLQTTGIDPSTIALTAFKQAVDGAAGSLSAKSTTTGEQSIADLFKVTSNDPSSRDFENESDRQSTEAERNAATRDATKSISELSDTNEQAAKSVIDLAAAAGRGGSAMSLLPAIIQAISAASATSGGSGGGGGWISSLFSLFGGSGGSSAGSASTAAEVAELAALFAHTGGVVGQIGTRRNVPASIFADVKRYHDGGIVDQRTGLRGQPISVFVGAPKYHEGGAVSGAAAPAALAANEVPAILMGGPRGTREEVLHARDPRHSDRIAPGLLKIIQGGGIDLFANARKYHEGGVVHRRYGEDDEDRKRRQDSDSTRLVADGAALSGLSGGGSSSTTTTILGGAGASSTGGGGGGSAAKTVGFGALGGSLGGAIGGGDKSSSLTKLLFGLAFHSGGVVGKAGKQRPIPVNVLDQAIKYHDGGIVGQRTDLRGIPINVFVDAPKYHEGGVAGAPGGSAAAIGGVGGPGGVGASAGQTIVGLTVAGGLGGVGVGGKGGDAAGGLGGKGGDAGNVFVSAAQQIIVPALKMLQGAAGIGGEAIAKAIGGLGGLGGNARSVGGIGGKGGHGGIGGPGGASISGQWIGGQAFAIGGAGGPGAAGGIGGNAFATGGPGGNAIGGDAFATAGQQMARQILTTIGGAPGGKGGDGGPGASAVGGMGGVGGIGGIGGQGIGGNAIGGHASVGRVQNLYTAAEPVQKTPESAHVADALSSLPSIQNLYTAHHAAQILGKVTASAVALGGTGGATGAPGRAFAEGGRAFGAPGADGVPGFAGSSALASVLRESRDSTSSLIDRARESSRESVSAFILAGKGTPEIASQGAPVVSVAALFAGTPGAAGIAGRGLGGAAGVAGVPGAGGLGGTAGAGGLGGAAGRAGLAGSGGIGGAAGSAGLGGAAGAPGAIFHLGQTVATQPAQISMFADAPLYHGGIIKGASVPGLQKNQIPTILLKNEEVLTRNDPRHRANIALLKTIEGGGIGGAGGLGGLGGNAFSVGGRGGIGGNGGDAFAGSAQMARQILTTIAGAPGGKGGDAIAAARESSSLMRTLLGPTNLISELRKETTNIEHFENSTIREIRETGARALGGPVTAGGMYRVNERGPEVVTMAGRQYMMPMQDGKVEPTEKSRERPLAVTNNFAFSAPVDRRSQQQVSAATLSGARRLAMRIS